MEPVVSPRFIPELGWGVWPSLANHLLPLEP